MASEEYGGAQHWSRTKQAVFAVVWISFLTAAVGTMLFFAAFSPEDLAGIVDDDLEIDANAGYAVGFFFFWLLCAACSGLTAFLVRTAPKRKAKRRQK